ncbi:DUF4835 family protein [bacterium]|nr:DUF4835 family protein [bacterium]
MQSPELPNKYWNFISFCSLFIFIFCCLILVTPAAAQRVAAKVTLNLLELPEQKQIEMENFGQVVQDYISSVDWVEDDQGGEFSINMQFLLSYIPVSGEDRYRANILVSNEKDFQVFDKRCRFAYQPNEILYFDNVDKNSLTSLIDYYVYFVLGHEYDKMSRLGGTPYFQKSLQRAEQARFGLAHFSDGWDIREKKVNEITSDNNKTFRIMKDIFFYGIYLFEDREEPELGRRYVFESLQMIDKDMPYSTIPENYTQFLNAYFDEVVKMFRNSPGANQVFTLLLRIHPEQQETYEQYVQ